jgi:AraC-like DNA-binding protein
MLQGLLIAILIQSILLALLCFSIRKHDRATVWLGGYLLAIAIQRIIHLAVHYTTFIDTYDALIVSYELTVLAGYWCLHRAALGWLKQETPWANRLPIGLSILYTIGFFIGYFGGYWPEASQYYAHPYSVVSYLVVCSYCFIIAYDSLKRIRAFRNSEEPVTEPRTWLILNSLRWLFFYAVGRCLMVITFLALRPTQPDPSSEMSDLDYNYLVVVNILLIGLLAIMAYFTLRNPSVFNLLEVAQTVEQKMVMAMLPDDTTVTVRANISDAEMQLIIAQVQAYMERERPWLNPRLTQAKLADLIGVPAYKLSHTLNQASGQHFNGYVNEYRIRYACELLLAPDRQRDTMYAIALDSGFASEAPFYAAFKKITGESPTAWKLKKTALDSSNQA